MAADQCAKLITSHHPNTQFGLPITLGRNIGVIDKQREE